VSQYTLEFVAQDLPPQGFKVYSFTKTSSRDQKPKTTIGNQETSFDIDDETGLLTSVTMNGVTMDVSQDFLFYTSASSSQAYIFTPDPDKGAQRVASNVKTTVIEGDVYVGVLQEFSSWARQLIKVYNNDNTHIEFD
jgi:lysosomal alpha-mannosidase